MATQKEFYDSLGQRIESENEEVLSMRDDVIKEVKNLNELLPSVGFRWILMEDDAYFSYEIRHNNPDEINLKELLEEIKNAALNSDYYPEAIKKKVVNTDLEKLIAGHSLTPLFSEEDDVLKAKKENLLSEIIYAAEEIINYGIKHRDLDKYRKRLFDKIISRVIIGNFGLDNSVERKYKFSFIFDGKAECGCGEVHNADEISFEFGYSKYYVCPNCNNSDFRILKKEDNEPQIWDTSEYVFTPKDEYSKDMLKMHRHHYMVGTWGGYMKRYRGDFRRVTMNIETGRTFFLSKSQEKYNWQLRSFKPIHAESFSDRLIERFIKEFLAEKDEYKELFNAISEDSNDGFAKVGEGIGGYELQEFLLKLAAVLNRNPELLDFIIYAYKNDTELMEVIVDNVLFNYPKGELVGSPDAVLAKIIGTEINSSVIKDYNKGKIKAKELYFYGELIRLFGLDNARDMFDKVHHVGHKEIRSLYKNIIDNSPDTTVAKKRVMKLFEKVDDDYVYITDKGRILRDIMFLKRAIEKNNGGEKIEVDLSNLSEEGARDIHNNLSALLGSIKQKINKKKFKSAARALKQYEYKLDKYQIVAPKSPEDITEEGMAMKHCVAGYVSEVADKNTKILFLRDKENQRVATIEVKRNKVLQVKAKRNNKPSVSAMEFVKKWANKKKIQFAGRW